MSGFSHSALPFPRPVPSCSNSISITNSIFLFSYPFHFNTHQYHSLSTPPSPKPSSFKFRPFLHNRASKSDPTTMEDDNDNYSSESLAEDGFFIEVMKLEKNSRRIQSRISIEAPLAAIWSILTDYDRLADFIPGLAVSQLLQKGDKYARLLQIGQQNLAFGIKFNAKVVVDCYEKDLETLPSGVKREIEFKMIEGDFQLFEGKWSILQQFNSGSCEESQVGEVKTTLSYIVDVKPKLWLPVRLIEGRLCNEIKMNLASVRDETLKATQRTVHAHEFE
ncbi:uncharacterized protein LOC133298731 isoform X2 [Gastrolobium bilobum]|uniref:uncharacterized protein LOC133298731 isoform X2 n=1 Tax=Gastrolobium bilobum TaxID=150636 RepID=UPI002AB2353F|nr:uncharacterized protein LOC133298731 isoform X2 [Gastrolobium bilobum]